MDVTHVLGDFGPVQKRVFAFCALRSFVLVGILYTVRFHAGVVEHWCAPSEAFKNLTTVDWKECCIPKEESRFSRCQRYQTEDDNISSTYIACDAWQFQPQNDSYTFIEEWDLVCDRRWRVSLLYTLYSTGGLLAYGISGYLSDKFGRRPCIFLGLIIILISTVGSAVSNSIDMFTLMQFLSGFGYAFLQHITVTLFAEIVGKKQRSFLPMFMTGIWGLATMLLSVSSMFMPTWRHFILIAVLPFQLLMLCMAIWMLPESPRWLLSVGKYERAEKELVTLAAINGIQIVDKSSVMEDLKKKVNMDFCEDKSSSGGFLKSKLLMTFAILILFINIARAFSGNGLHINLAHFGGNAKMNYFILGFTGLPALAAFELSKRFFKLRRLSLVVCHIISGASLIILIFIDDEFYWLKLSILMTGRILKKVANDSMYLVAVETFPTHLRGKGMAFYMVALRIGGIMSSYTDLFVYKYGQNALMILLGVINFALCFGVVFLPETQEKFLPDSVRESEMLTKNETSLDDQKKMVFHVKDENKGLE